MDLLDAIEMLATSGAGDIRLTLAGNLGLSSEGYVVQVRDRIRSAPLASIVRIVDTPTDGQLADLYARSDLLVMPSHHEGYCLPVIEALAAGCQVVSSDAGNLPNTVGDVGTTVRCGDVVELARQISAVSTRFCAGRRGQTPQQVRVADVSIDQADWQTRVRRHLEHYTRGGYEARFLDVLRWAAARSENDVVSESVPYWKRARSRGCTVTTSGRSVSVVINTYNRAASLRLTLCSLEQLDYTNFEVVVVNGPSVDDTDAVIADYGDRIKVGRIPNRNLSESRNAGIALAAGEIVAFIDDDAYADPGWLDELVAGYDDDEVAGVGGPLYDHTGANLQVRYSLVDRFGRGTVEVSADPTALFNRPFTLQFAHMMGANSSFRRDRLAEMGGFDEEFEYFLDESDVCCRMVDRGFVIRELNSGFVYHKALPSDVRMVNRVVKDRHTVLKNTAYFAMKHGLSIYPFSTVSERISAAIEEQRADYRRHVASGDLSKADLAEFEADVPLAVDEGFASFQRGHPRVRDTSFFASPQPFRCFGVARSPDRRLHVCFFSQEWAPTQLNGIARFVTALATGLAQDGHVVRVLTRGEDHDRVDLEDGVWVHRVAVEFTCSSGGRSGASTHLGLRRLAARRAAAHRRNAARRRRPDPKLGL